MSQLEGDMESREDHFDTSKIKSYLLDWNNQTKGKK